MEQTALQYIIEQLQDIVIKVQSGKAGEVDMRALSVCGALHGIIEQTFTGEIN